MFEKSIMIIPETKHAQTELFVTFFEYKPYRRGAKNAPANAPQLIPISEAKGSPKTVTVSKPGGDNSFKAFIFEDINTMRPVVLAYPER